MHQSLLLLTLCRDESKERVYYYLRTLARSRNLEVHRGRCFFSRQHHGLRPRSVRRELDFEEINVGFAGTEETSWIHQWLLARDHDLELESYIADPGSVDVFLRRCVAAEEVGIKRLIALTTNALSEVPDRYPFTPAQLEWIFQHAARYQFDILHGDAIRSIIKSLLISTDCKIPRKWGCFAIKFPEIRKHAR